MKPTITKTVSIYLVIATSIVLAVIYVFMIPSALEWKIMGVKKEVTQIESDIQTLDNDIAETQREITELEASINDAKKLKKLKEDQKTAKTNDRTSVLRRLKNLQDIAAVTNDVLSDNLSIITSGKQS